MADDAILKKVIQGLGQIATETGKETLKQGEEVLHGVITGKELLGSDIKSMTDQEMAQKRAEDERRKQQELAELRAQMGQGRPVEQEMTQIRREEEQSEEQKRQQAIREENERRQAESQTTTTEIPTNPKKSAAKHQGAGGKKKKSQPDPTQMSQTTEFKGKID